MLFFQNVNQESGEMNAKKIALVHQKLRNLAVQTVVIASVRLVGRVIDVPKTLMNV